MPQTCKNPRYELGWFKTKSEAERIRGKLKTKGLAIRKAPAKLRQQGVNYVITRTKPNPYMKTAKRPLSIATKRARREKVKKALKPNRPQYKRTRIASPKEFAKKSFRTIPVGKKGDKLIVACPKGQFKAGRCVDGMEVQAVLKAKKNGGSQGRLWRVFRGGKLVDRVWFISGMKADEVKRALVEHDNYPPDITVKATNLLARTYTPKSKKVNGNPLLMVVPNPSDRERGLWVDNEEGLYNWWRSSRLSKSAFIKEHRGEIDQVIARVTGREAKPYRARPKPDYKAWIGGNPKVKSIDEVGMIMDYESGQLSANDTLRLFSHLLKTGRVWHLQGHYGRTATALIEAGYVDRQGKILRRAPKGNPPRGWHRKRAGIYRGRLADDLKAGHGGGADYWQGALSAESASLAWHGGVKKNRGGSSVRKTFQAILDKYGLKNKFTVRTVSFSDLARASAMVITVKGWRPSPVAEQIKKDVRAAWPTQAGWRPVIVEFTGPGIVGNRAGARNPGSEYHRKARVEALRYWRKGNLDPMNKQYWQGRADAEDEALIAAEMREERHLRKAAGAKPGSYDAVYHSGKASGYAHNRAGKTKYSRFSNPKEALNFVEKVKAQGATPKLYRKGKHVYVEYPISTGFRIAAARKRAKKGKRVRANPAMDMKELLNTPEGKKALKLYREVHGCEPKSVERRMLPLGGSQKVTGTEFFVSLGTAPAESYEPPKTSRKAGSIFVHPYEGKHPVKAVSADGRTIVTFPGRHRVKKTLGDREAWIHG